MDSKTGQFCASGHYPILAGYDHSGSALYIAQFNSNANCHCDTSDTTNSERLRKQREREKFDGYPHRLLFAGVPDGASTATSMDIYGNKKTTADFKVLLHGYDPCDWTSAYWDECANTGQLDPSGPAHWRKFWPEKDSAMFAEPNYRKSPTLMEDMDKIWLELDQISWEVYGLDEGIWRMLESCE